MKSIYSLLYLTIILFAFAACSPKQNESKNSEALEAETSNEEDSEIAGNEVSLLNPNLATAEELSSIVEESLANQIVENKPFLTMMQFDELISGTMEDSQKNELYAKVFVPMNLNTTPEEDFKIIPGVGDKMAHEFEEYRPYAKIEQFRREIGKYVDEQEVARYEQYVFVPVELNTATAEEILAIPGVGERMKHEFEEYRPYQNMEQFRKEIGKYVDEAELARLERFVYLSNSN